MMPRGFGSSPPHTMTHATSARAEFPGVRITSRLGLLIPIRREFCRQYANLRRVTLDARDPPRPCAILAPGDLIACVVPREQEANIRKSGTALRRHRRRAGDSTGRGPTRRVVEPQPPYAFSNWPRRRPEETLRLRRTNPMLTCPIPFWIALQAMSPSIRMSGRTSITSHSDSPFVRTPYCSTWFVYRSLSAILRSDLGTSPSPGRSALRLREPKPRARLSLRCSQPFHGSGARYCSQGVSNPIGQIWSGAMMLNLVPPEAAGDPSFPRHRNCAEHGPRARAISVGTLPPIRFAGAIAERGHPCLGAFICSRHSPCCNSRDALPGRRLIHLRGDAIVRAIITGCLIRFRLTAKSRDWSGGPLANCGWLLISIKVRSRRRVAPMPGANSRFCRGLGAWVTEPSRRLVRSDGGVLLATIACPLARHRRSNPGFKTPGLEAIKWALTGVFEPHGLADFAVLRLSRGSEKTVPWPTHRSWAGTDTSRPAPSAWVYAIMRADPVLAPFTPRPTRSECGNEVPGHRSILPPLYDSASRGISPQIALTSCGRRSRGPVGNELRCS